MCVLVYLTRFVSSPLALGYVKDFFFTTESSALLVITDSLVISWSFLVDSLSSQLKHFCSFNSLSCQIFFVSELYLFLQGIRGRKWVPSDPSLCTTWFVTVYYALNVSEDDCWFSLEI